MDWTTPLRSLQADFIARLHSDAAVLHHLTNPQLRGYFSEMTIVSGAELAQVRQDCWSVADRLKHLSGQPIYDVFISHFYATMGELVARKYLDGLVSPVDRAGLGADFSRSDRLLRVSVDNGGASSILVKVCHGHVDAVRWELPAQSLDKNTVLLCILIREPVTEAQLTYQVVMAGFLPFDIIAFNHGIATLAIGELLYAGGLKSYLTSLFTQQIAPDMRTFSVPNVVPKPNNSEVPKWQCLQTLRGHAGAVSSVAISPDGQTIASGSSDNNIKIWQLLTGSLLLTLTGHADAVLSVAFSPDGLYLASGSKDKTVNIWHLETGSLWRSLSGHADAVESVLFSSDRKTIATGGWDEKMKIWHLETGELLHTMDGHSQVDRAFAISPDGETITSSSSQKTIELWHLKTGKLICSLPGHADAVESVAFSADGQFLVSGSRDKTIKVWRRGSS
ncbi:MAG: WD40 repeat domain-containing protein [Hormoscilla sp. GM102CHS1]|nr:WD40 repeat domain-containing protein [Hormoscilla sp. GM102CHS1]